MGLFVLFKNRRSAVNRSFFILALSLSIRDFSYFILSHITAVPAALFWSRIAYCGVVFITASTYHFIVSFLNLQKKRFVYLFYSLSLLFALIAITNKQFIVGVKMFFWGYYPQVGFTIHNLFLVLWIIPFILSLQYLYTRYKEEKSPFNKKRIKYFLVTFPIAYLGVIDYIPSYGIEMYPFGLIPVTFFVISTTYAIVRYRLLDIEIMIKKLSLVTLAFVISVSAIYIGSFYLQPYFFNLWGKNWLVFPISISFLVGLGLFRFINFVKRIEEDELSKRFAYRPLIKKEAQRISMARNINELLIYIMRDLSNWVKLDYVGMFIWNVQRREFTLARSLTRTGRKKRVPSGLVLTQDNPLVIELLREKKPLVYSEIEYYLRSRAVLQEKREFLSKVTAEMQRLNAEISIPSFCEEQLLAIINIGHKLNPDEIITNEDLEIFSSLSSHIARAVYGFMLKEEKIQLIVASQNILINAIEAKDRYTRGHTYRVAHYSTLIGKRLEKHLRSFSNGLSDLSWAALLHDIGKITIPDAILLKRGPLNQEEWAKIKEHPINGIKIIMPVQEWLGEDIYAGILHHHENYDGTGYPLGQKGEDIHLFARMIRVADTFDALTSDRPYRAALTKEEAIEELKIYRGIHFDPLIVDVIEELYKDGEI